MPPVLQRFRVILLLCLVIGLYAPSIGNAFPNDDRYVAKAFSDPGIPNDMVHTLQPLGEYFGSLYWLDLSARPRRPQEIAHPLYRPLTVLSFALVYHAAGKHLAPESEGLPQHLLNVILHAACVWLVLQLLRPFAGDGWAAWLGAAAFGLNAIHVESVAAIFGRAELMSFGFGALGLVLWLRGWESPAPRGSLERLAAALCLFLAVCSKETGLVWLPFWWLYAVARDWASGDERRRPPLPRQLLHHGVRALAVGAVPVLAFFLLRHGALAELQSRPPVPWVMNPLASSPTVERLLTATMLWGYGLYKTLLPLFLCSDWGASVFEPVTSPLDPRFLAALLALGSALVLGLAVARRVPLLFLAVAAFFGFGFLTSNLPFAIGIQFAERLYFSPSLALAFVTSWVASALAPRRGLVNIALAAFVAWSAINAWTIVRRCPVWREDATLYPHDAAIQPRSMFLRINAVVIARLAGDKEAAERHLREAVAIEPRFAKGWHELSRVHMERGEIQQAEDCLRRGLASPTAHRQKDLPGLHFDTGFLEAMTDRPVEAAKSYGAALDLDPRWFTAMLAKFFPVAHGKLRNEDVLAILERGRRLSGHNPLWVLLHGMQLVRAGRPAEAEPLLRAAVPAIQGFELLPDARLYYGKALLDVGKKQEAMHVLRAVSTDPAASEAIRAQALGFLR